MITNIKNNDIATISGGMTCTCLYKSKYYSWPSSNTKTQQINFVDSKQIISSGDYVYKIIPNAVFSTQSQNDCLNTCCSITLSYKQSSYANSISFAWYISNTNNWYSSGEYDIHGCDE